MKHNEKVYHAQYLGSYALGQRSKLCLSNNSKTTEANLMKLHRKIEHNEKVLGTEVRLLCPRSRSQSCQIELKIRSE